MQITVRRGLAAALSALATLAHAAPGAASYRLERFQAPYRAGEAVVEARLIGPDGSERVQPPQAVCIAPAPLDAATAARLQSLPGAAAADCAATVLQDEPSQARIEIRCGGLRQQVTEMQRVDASTLRVREQSFAANGSRASEALMTTRYTGKACTAPPAAQAAPAVPAGMDKAMAEHCARYQALLKELRAKGEMPPEALAQMEAEGRRTCR